MPAVYEERLRCRGRCWGIGSGNRLSALANIWRAVNALARVAAAAIDANLPVFQRGFGSPVRAFKKIFGPTHIAITSNGSTPKGYYGQNDGFSKKYGAFHIQLALSKVLGTNGTAGMIGVGLVAHEIAHNITLGDGAGDPHSYNQYLSDNTLMMDEKKVEPSTLYEKENEILKYLTWNPGEHGPELYVAYEVSADIIANLALDGIRNGSIRNHANNWWVSNMGTFMNNTAGCVDGSRTCLP